ncbi:transglutaminase family protein [Roseisalinus antarcticus]|uniref:Protein-glutamine gamma-glutamyltransferase n=1 Tax=Roseisalinus antarcticus TaxID=254357 RepID=A0A1Y5TKG0_9RHOB|nr:transglutaminase family protein [Roseisalinus antarcticus]SLN66146.1 Protein-glutamine gamma-glutamyltransferase [Roseisalinus antarcticus]
MSVLYDISLAIIYNYDQPAAASREMLRILPRTLPEQQLVSGLVTTEPAPDFRRDTVDFFGNPATEVVFDRPLDAVTFRFSGRVRRRAESTSLDLSPGLTGLAQDIAEAQSLGNVSPHHFLGPSERVRPLAEITDFARANVDTGTSTLSMVLALSAALHREMTFDPTATEVATPPLEAFRNRRGVCQDFSHMMIAALRGLGIPAGYVSGFLRTLPPEGQERLEGADAMHAWVQAWCGAEMGWVQFDPTNDIIASTDHVVVALGRDYSDVAPIKGSLRSAGSHTSRHEVDVKPVGGN